MVRSVFADGYSWVEIDDQAWEHAVFIEVIAGVEMDWC